MRQVKMTRDSFHVFQANACNALKQSEQAHSSRSTPKRPP